MKFAEWINNQTKGMDWFVLMERRTKQQQLRGKLKWNPIKQMEMKFVWWMELKGQLRNQFK